MSSRFRIHPEYTYLTCALVLSALLLIADVPPWAAISTVVFFLWRLLIEHLKWPTPSRWITGALSVVFLIATLYTFKSWIGKEVSSCFLIILTSLKILELQDESEKSFLILLGFFLISSKFLFSLDLIYVAIQLPVLFVLIYSLYPNGYFSENKKKKVLSAFKMILLAIPLTAFLFVFFPRFTQKFIEIQGNQDNVGLSGFSDSVQPGQVSKLVQSNDLAFRAELKNRSLANEDLYWKGQVLTEPSGMIWKRGPIEIVKDEPSAVTEEDYKVTLEPTGRRWLFFLDQTKALQSENFKLQKTQQQIYFATDNLTTRTQYVGQIANAKSQVSKSKHDELIAELKVQEKDPQLVPILQELQFDDKNPDTFATKLNEYFKEKQFYYTLSPGDQGNLQLIDFLLKTKKGFCEHFASSAALLFREVNIPSRVVIGYQGGVYNRNGNFWSITQKDAHAWVEYLNQEHQWVRYDPTSAIAPLRLELGAQAYFNLNESEIRNLSKDELKRKLSNFSAFEDLQFWAENINYKWNIWLLDYDLEKQKNWLKKFNLDVTSLSLMALAICLIATLVFQFLIEKKYKKSDFEILHSELNSFFKKQQLFRKPNEGPQEWKSRILCSSRYSADLIDQIFDIYIAAGYKKNYRLIRSEEKKFFSYLQKLKTNSASLL